MVSGWGGRGSTRAWRAVRAQILVRDGERCQLQLPGCTHAATEVHHRAGKAAGDDPRNLVASCRACNLAIGDPRRHNPAPRGVTKW